MRMPVQSARYQVAPFNGWDEAGAQAFARTQEEGRAEADLMAEQALAEQAALAERSRANQGRATAMQQAAGLSSWERYLAGLAQSRGAVTLPRTVDAVRATPTAVPVRSGYADEVARSQTTYQRNLARSQAEAAQGQMTAALGRTPVGGTVAVNGRLYRRTAEGLAPFDGLSEGAVEFADPVAMPASMTAVTATPDAVPRLTGEERRAMLTRAGVPWSSDDLEMVGATDGTSDADFGEYVKRTAAKYRGVVPEWQRVERDVAGRAGVMRGELASRNALAAEQRARAEAELAANRRRVAPAWSPYTVSNL